MTDSYNFVLDCSIAMAWCFEDESNEFTDSILDSFTQSNAIVPTIWPLEVANVLLQAKKHKRITEVQSASFIGLLTMLPIIVDPSTTSRAMHSTLALAGETDLTIYDAAYLELSLREGIPLLSLDKNLLKAAKKMGVATSVFNP